MLCVLWSVALLSSISVSNSRSTRTLHIPPELLHTPIIIKCYFTTTNIIFAHTKKIFLMADLFEGNILIHEIFILLNWLEGIWPNHRCIWCWSCDIRNNIWFLRLHVRADQNTAPNILTVTCWVYCNIVTRMRGINGILVELFEKIVHFISCQKHISPWIIFICIIQF